MSTETHKHTHPLQKNPTQVHNSSEVHLYWVILRFTEANWILLKFTELYTQEYKMDAQESILVSYLGFVLGVVSDKHDMTLSLYLWELCQAMEVTLEYLLWGEKEGEERKREREEGNRSQGKKRGDGGRWRMDRMGQRRRKLSEACNWFPSYQSPTHLLIELFGCEVVGFLRSVEPAAIQPLEEEENYRVKLRLERSERFISNSQNSPSHLSTASQ